LIDENKKCLQRKPDQPVFNRGRLTVKAPGKQKGNIFFSFTLKYKVLFYLCVIIQNITIMITKNKRLSAILLTVVLMLLVPLIAMQFTSDVNWSVFDFAVASVLLFGTGLLCEFVMRKVKTMKLRIIICAVILIALFLIWAELAVGIFGTPFAGS
jgi:peptidoglycan/LPS O-acetylase OafA/YrhL